VPSYSDDEDQQVFGDDGWDVERMIRAVKRNDEGKK
jgi:hypothetical protein